MNTDSYKQFLLSNISPWAKTEQGGRVVVCRCFYCSDSKHHNHGHFYINIPSNDTEPSYFYCQKCHVGGLVTPKKLLEWGLYDSDIATELSSYNKRILNLPENRKFKDSEIYKIYNDTISEDKLSEFKLNYINSRLGQNFSYQDCINMKIVLNLTDLVSRNKLEYSRNNAIVEQLDSGFLGFLSYDNAFLSMRNLDIVNNLYKSINGRYVNYNIFNKYDNTKRFYTFPNKIDLLNPKPIQLHIAEGAFDILGIIFNLRGGNLDQCVYSSIGGSGYEGVLRFFITELKTPNLEIHLYPDTDIERDFILRIINNIKVFRYPVYIHRNLCKGEKDFGVTSDRINEAIERVM